MEIQKSNDKGFTLVELLIVIVILGILATVTVFAVQGITTRGKETACNADHKTLQTAIEANMADTGSYPADFAELETNGLLADGSVSGNFKYTAPGGTSTVAPFKVAPANGYLLEVDPAQECNGVI